MHEDGHTYTERETIAAGIAAEGVFTVLNLEWHDNDRQPWVSDVGQIERAVAYVQAHAGKLGAASAPATYLAASESEATTANLDDERELAAKLIGLGVASEVFAPHSGHGFACWKGARPSTLAFLTREATE